MTYSEGRQIKPTSRICDFVFWEKMKLHELSGVSFLLVLFCASPTVKCSEYLKCLQTNTESFKECLNSNYAALSPAEILKSRDEVKRMFHFGYDNYMEYAYPEDELDPIHCTGRGHDYVDE